ncbi:MAG: Cna B-type domain-containing protein [Bulleidia sp.]|nr:Cna B-type domain-containing protein [Bulleidia sp.]
MKFIKKIFSMWIVLTIIFGSLPLPYVKAVSDEGITFRHIQIPSSRTDTTEFLTGEIMQSTLILKANLPESEYSGTYIELSIQDNVGQYVDQLDVLVPSDSEVFENEQKINNSTWRIPVKPNDDAREVQLPIYTKFKTYVTPDKTNLSIIATLKKSDGTVVKQAETVHFLAKAGEADYSMNVRGGQNQIGGLSSNGTTLDAVGLVDVVFNYETFVKSSRDDYGIFTQTDYGQRAFDYITLTQPLPPFAKFDASKNPNWTYDAQTNVATYTLNRKDYNDIHGYNPVALRLTFPNATLNTTYTATSTMVFHPLNKGDNEQTITTSKVVNYRFNHETTNGLPFQKYFSFESGDGYQQGVHTVTNISNRLSKGLKWNLLVSNTGNEMIEFIEFKDYSLDSRLYYTGVSMPKSDDIVLNDFSGNVYDNISNITVKGIMEDGSIQTLGTVSSGRTLNFSSAVARNIKSIFFEFPSQYKLAPKKIVSFNINTAFRETPTISTKDDENYYDNSGSYSAIYTRGNGTTYTFTGNDTARFKLVDPKPNFGVKKLLSEKLGTGWFSRTREEPNRADGELAIWTIDVPFDEDFVKGVSSSTVLNNVEIVDLLPEGVTYVSASANGGFFATGKPTSITYVPNYNDSGLNAVVIRWNSVTARQINSFLANSDAIQIITRVNSNSTPGHNDNYVLVKYDGEFVHTIEENHMDWGYGGIPYKDNRDIDQDGDTAEVFSATSAYYEYSARNEVLSRKYIARETVDNWNKEGLKTGADTAFRYKLWNYNNQENLSNFEILDILPHRGDTSSAADATTNRLQPRNSQFSNVMTGPIQFTSSIGNKFEVEYTTDAIVGEVDHTNNNLSWTTNITDFTQVTGIRIKLKSGQTFNRGELLEAIVPMKAPSAGQLGDRAFNNFSIATRNTQATPTNLVWNELYIPSSSLKIVKKSIEGDVLSNAVFTITSKSDPTKTYEVTTQDNGEFEIILPLGEYEVVEKIAPSGYIKDTIVYTVSIIEDETATLEVVNYPLIDISINKVWEDNINQDGIRPNEIKVNLLADGVKVQEVTVTSQANWTYTFSNLPKYQNGQEIVYTIDEEDVVGYNKAINGYTITNTHEPETTKIVIKKLWEDRNNEFGQRPNTIVIRLFANGEEYSVHQITQQMNWKKEISNLPIYKDGKKIVYSLKEDAIAGYRSEVNGFVVTNYKDTPPIPPHSNLPKTGDAMVNKVWLGIIFIVSSIVTLYYYKRKNS